MPEYGITLHACQKMENIGTHLFFAWNGIDNLINVTYTLRYHRLLSPSSRILSIREGTWQRLIRLLIPRSSLPSGHHGKRCACMMWQPRWELRFTMYALIFRKRMTTSMLGLSAET